MNIPLKYLDPPVNIELSKKGDKADPKIGETISSSISAYRKADFVIVGSPQDMGVRRNKGRAGARKAPHSIRKELYSFPVPADFSGTQLFDLGDIRISSTLEKTHLIQYNIIHQLLVDGKRLIILGGGNDISYPDAKALHSSTNGYLAFNIDSHLDVRENEPRNSGTPYRQLLEEGFLQPEYFYEMAIKPVLNADTYLEYLHEKKAHIVPLSEMREFGIDTIFKKILNQNKVESIFWGIDMDSVRSADAPGVSAPYPVGLTSDELCHIAEIAGSDPRSRILEISEVNPDYDMDSRTSRLAAMVILHYINAARKSERR